MDPYKSLGLKKDATDEDIKKAYKALVSKWHPDRHIDDKEEATEKFKEVASAYEILEDPQKKAEYDRFGTTGGRRSRPAAGFRDFNFFGDNFDSVFNQFFRGGKQTQGEHIQVVVSVTLNEILRGLVKEIKYSRREKCDTCSGTGAKTMRTCPQCEGKGAVHQRHGPMTVQTTCPVCRGTGDEVQEVCGDCNGMGLTAKKERTTSIKIPAGVESGMQLFFQGQGEPARGKGVPGNLYILAKVEDHEFFDRGQNGDLLCKIPVSYTQLILGDKIIVPTLESAGIFDMPPGTPSGTKFKLAGKGLPRPGEEYREHNSGSIIATVEVEVPENLPEDYMEIIQKLTKMEKQHMTPKRKKYNE